MSNQERPTRKRVQVELDLTFEGDYIPVNQIMQYLQGWLDSGLCDRDDLKAWSVSLITLYETPLDE
jgi:hypothetical protein